MRRSAIRFPDRSGLRITFAVGSFLLLAVCVQPSHAYDIADRWDNTITDGPGIVRGDAITLLWSIVPDGETWSRSGIDRTPSDLIDYLDVGWNVPFGSRVPDLTNRPWWALMDRVYEQYERVSGLTLTYTPETNADGTDSGNFGDLQIGGYPFAEENKGGVLATNAFPNNGDMLIDTYRGNDGVPSYWHTNPAALRNLISHESGHGVGLSHTDIFGANSVMETPLEISFWGLQFDDVYAFNRLYGDPLEKNGGNDSAISAHDFSVISAGDSVSLGLDAADSSVDELDDDWLGIDGTTDEDWFSFFVTEPVQIDLTISPMGPSYTTHEQGTFDAQAQADLNFEIYGADGATPLTSVDATDIGEAEQLASYPLTESGRYYVRVNSEADLNQFYRIDLAIIDDSPPVNVTPGDFDLDGDVDGSDFLAWQRVASVGSLADWQTNYGNVDSTALQATPEPHSLFLALASILALAQTWPRTRTR